MGHSSQDKLFDSLCTEVLENSMLTLFPRFVQGAGSAFSAGAILHDAADDTEGSFYGFYGLPQRYLARRTRQLGASTATLFALHQPGVGESGQDAGQKAARNVGVFGDPVRSHPLIRPGKVDKSPQSVSALAAQLELHASLSLPGSLVLLLISIKAYKSGNAWRVSTSLKNFVDLKDIVAPAGDRTGVIWTLDTNSDLNINLA
jgi:hypothetical protein